LNLNPKFHYPYISAVLEVDKAVDKDCNLVEAGKAVDKDCNLVGAGKVADTF
jgi:hypothetical protein